MRLLLRVLLLRRLDRVLGGSCALLRFCIFRWKVLFALVVGRDVLRYRRARCRVREEGYTRGRLRGGDALSVSYFGRAIICLPVCLPACLSSGFKRFQARSNTNQESRCPIAHPLEPRAVPGGSPGACGGLSMRAPAPADCAGLERHPQRDGHMGLHTQMVRADGTPPLEVVDDRDVCGVAV